MSKIENFWFYPGLADGLTLKLRKETYRFVFRRIHRAVNLSIVVCIAILAVSCGPIRFTPSVLSTLETNDSWRNSPPYPCPPATSGIFQFNPSINEAGAGINLVFDEGTEPAPCQEWHGVLAKANFVFDQTELQETLRSLTFDKAKLTFQVRSTGRAVGGPDLTGGGCLLRLGVATEPWPTGVTRLPSGAAGSLPGYRLVGSEAYLLREPLPTGFLRSVDVTAEVRSWLDGTTENHGFVLIPFAAPDSTREMELNRLRRLTASCSAFVAKFRLEISGR